MLVGLDTAESHNASSPDGEARYLEGAGEDG